MSFRFVVTRSVVKNVLTWRCGTGLFAKVVPNPTVHLLHCIIICFCLAALIQNINFLIIKKLNYREIESMFYILFCFWQLHILKIEFNSTTYVLLFVYLTAYVQISNIIHLTILYKTFLVRIKFDTLTHWVIQNGEARRLNSSKRWINIFTHNWCAVVLKRISFLFIFYYYLIPLTAMVAMNCSGLLW